MQSRVLTLHPCSACVKNENCSPLFGRCHPVIIWFLVSAADFGFAQHMSPWDEKHVLRGSPLYMAPEMVCRQQYDARVDLWSVGVILYGESAMSAGTSWARGRGNSGEVPSPQRVLRLKVSECNRNRDSWFQLYTKTHYRKGVIERKREQGSTTAIEGKIFRWGALRGDSIEMYKLERGLG
ncbi:hypothetical protein chiPu_0029189 [Chiloscyllium punctatum]|uniref:non-specific serine/threonine protein kinase n=1 Tax=Chiloscyllium punctatum TaxID=137246 RepID=A0A401TRP4_CHIPU|nr:hypothetical protein [Chiloscyllium punctatum]